MKKRKNDDQSQIVPLLRFEEGVRYTPYIDSRGYPTTGVGFKLGPAGASLSNYTFTLRDYTIDAWLTDNLTDIYAEMANHDQIAEAVTHCNQSRNDILTSMAYQMGVDGLAEFHHMLDAVIAEDWEEAAAQMLDSAWAHETPGRAEREAEVMSTGDMGAVYDF